jgi:uncharacterized protein (TIGR02145 family)
MKKDFFYLLAVVVLTFTTEVLQAQSVTPTSDPGVTVNGVTWATRNVGEAGKFVTNPEDFGGYFNSEEAKTACPEGWRAPLMDEFGGLIDTPSISEWVKVNGVAGRSFGTGDNTFFLPAAGDYHTGENKAEGITGSYWSSTVHPNEFDGRDYGSKYVSCGMWIGDDGCNGFFYQGDSTVSRSLRCVRK